MVVRRAQHIAGGVVANSGDRWLHVQAVAARAESLLPEGHPGRSPVVAAAWLHDIGYATSVAETGFHPLDGARFLARQGFTSDVVGLVAYHSGADFEAEERGLLDELRAFEAPNRDLLDILTLADLTTSPSGAVVGVDDRISEILSRYAQDDPVFRAVRRSHAHLRDSSRRAAHALGHPSAYEGLLLTR